MPLSIAAGGRNRQRVHPKVAANGRQAAATRRSRHRLPLVHAPPRRPPPAENQTPSAGRPPRPGCRRGPVPRNAPRRHRGARSVVTAAALPFRRRGAGSAAPLPGVFPERARPRARPRRTAGLDAGPRSAQRGEDGCPRARPAPHGSAPDGRRGGAAVRVRAPGRARAVAGAFRRRPTVLHRRRRTGRDLRRAPVRGDHHGSRVRDRRPDRPRSRRDRRCLHLAHVPPTRWSRQRCWPGAGPSASSARR
jgi:hypothetical protein